MIVVPIYYKWSHWIVGIVGGFLIIASLSTLTIKPIDWEFFIWTFLIGSVLSSLAILKKRYDKKHGIDYFYRYKVKK